MVVAATVPPVGIKVIGLVAEKLPPLVSEISYPVGAETVISLVKLEPETVNVCSDDGELMADAIKVFKVPVAMTAGDEDTFPVIEISSK
jgi:hypothetical protein